MSIIARTDFVAIFLACGAICSHAKSSGICPGTIRAQVMGPTPSPLRVHPEKTLADFASPDLALLFFRRVGEAAGIPVADTGNARLTTIFTIIAPPSSGLPYGSYPGFDWVGNGQRLRSTKLSMIGVLGNDQEHYSAWLVTIECTIGTEDPAALVEYLGKVIGRSLGKEVDGKTM
jgi:hypothetical protein